MNRFLAVVAAFVLTISVSAQVKKWGETEKDSLDCFVNFNDFGVLYNGKSYADAYEPWKVVYNTCPQVNEVIYKYAPKIFKYKIKATEDSATQHALATELMGVYDQRMALYPGNEAKTLGAKASDHYKYFKDAWTAYHIFQEAFEIDAAAIQPSYLNAYFNTVIKLYKMDSLDNGELLNAYAAVSEAIQLQSIQLNQDIRMLTEKDTLGTISAREKRALSIKLKIQGQSGTLIKNIEKGIGKLLTCDGLAKIYTEETFDANKDDAVWLRRTLKMLAKEKRDTASATGWSDCTDNPVYYLAAQALYDMDPSAPAARSMGRLSVKNEKWDEAVTYFQSAVDQELDPVLQAQDYLRMATCYMQLDKLSSAKSAALNSAKADPSIGEPYLIIAQAYGKAAGTCGANAFEKNAVYWAAMNKAARAKSIDPELTRMADALINAYRGAVPDKTIAFQFGWKEGDSYTIGCWINERVVVHFFD